MCSCVLPISAAMAAFGGNSYLNLSYYIVKLHYHISFAVHTTSKSNVNMIAKHLLGLKLAAIITNPSRVVILIY